MISEEDIREQKQQFLREEILEKNYNTSQFISYLVDKFGDNAADLDVYTLDELKSIVGEFTSRFPKQNAPNVYEDPDSDKEEDTHKQKTSTKARISETE